MCNFDFDHMMKVELKLTRRTCRAKGLQVGTSMLTIGTNSSLELPPGSMHIYKWISTGRKLIKALCRSPLCTATEDKWVSSIVSPVLDVGQTSGRVIRGPPCSCRSAHQGRRCLPVEGDQCDSSPAALAAAEVNWANSQRLCPSAVCSNAPNKPLVVIWAVGHQSSVARQAL